MDLERARTAEESGGGGAPYKPPHEPAGSSKGGQFTGNPSGGGSTSKPKPKAHTPAKPIVAVKSTHHGPVKLGGDNDPEQVKQLQALLGVLGLGRPPTSGEFDDATEQAVMEAQRRLGLKPNGHASTALLNKLITAHALSPCVQRSEGYDDFDLLRAALDRGDYDENHVLDNGICVTCAKAGRSVPR